MKISDLKIILIYLIVINIRDSKSNIDPPENDGAYFDLFNHDLNGLENHIKISSDDCGKPLTGSTLRD